MNDNHAFPIAFAAEGEQLRIASLTAGKGLRRRLGDLGLPLGAEITVVLRHPNGSIVISRNNHRVGLGEGMTQKIMVVLVNSSKA